MSQLSFQKTYSMKLTILVTLILLTYSYNAWGQDSLHHKQPLIIRDLSTINKNTQYPLIIIKADNRVLQVGSKSDFINRRKVKKALKHFDADWVDSITVIKDKSATEKYGSLGRHGVLILNLKKGTFDKLPRRLRKYEVTE